MMAVQDWHAHERVSKDSFVLFHQSFAFISQSDTAHHTYILFSTLTLFELGFFPTLKDQGAKMAHRYNSCISSQLKLGSNFIWIMFTSNS